MEASEEGSGGLEVLALRSGRLRALVLAGRRDEAEPYLPDLLSDLAARAEGGGALKLPPTHPLRFELPHLAETLEELGRGGEVPELLRLVR